MIELFLAFAAIAMSEQAPIFNSGYIYEVCSIKHGMCAVTESINPTDAVHDCFYYYRDTRSYTEVRFEDKDCKLHIMFKDMYDNQQIQKQKDDKKQILNRVKKIVKENKK